MRNLCLGVVIGMALLPAVRGWIALYYYCQIPRLDVSSTERRQMMQRDTHAPAQ